MIFDEAKFGRDIEGTSVAYLSNGKFIIFTKQKVKQCYWVSRQRVDQVRYLKKTKKTKEDFYSAISTEAGEKNNIALFYLLESVLVQYYSSPDRNASVFIHGKLWTDFTPDIVGQNDFWGELRSSSE